MTNYTSPILGDKKVSEEIYKHITTYKALGFQELLSIMKRDFGYGFLHTGLLFLETEFDEPKEFIGAELYTYLINIGMSSSQSESLVKLFSTNNRLIEHLVEQGFSVNDVVYGMDFKSRLKSLNLTSATTQRSYAFEDSFMVYQLLEFEIEEPPPPPERCYRSSLAYAYSSKKSGYDVEVRIWYQSYDEISESDIIDKWNEAMEIIATKANSELADALNQLEQIGYELNTEIDESDIVGELNEWYGRVIFIRDESERYIYDIFDNFVDAKVAKKPHYQKRFSDYKKFGLR